MHKFSISKFIFSIIFVILTLFLAKAVSAEGIKNCENRYVTFVNPVRSRNLWLDRSLKPLIEQYSLAQRYEIPVTWLIQLDVIDDQEAKDIFKTFNSSQELGVFLEVSPSLAQKARVIYPYDAPWFYPRAVFLSGYTQSDRKLLIDRIFKDFKKEFGYFPKSVGAWWIDSYSLNYLKNKYQIEAVMIVADQKTTDGYGVWGQWWGVPYYPSKANVLIPGVGKQKLDVSVIQWAERDPLDSNKPGWQSSNHSLQANDYINIGKNTEYFKSLVDVYLDCRNPIGQITIGLETGQESVGFISEYENQIKYLKSINNLKPLTMSNFAKKFKETNSDNLSEVKIERQNSVYEMHNKERINNFYNEKIPYIQNVSFSDYFIPDKTNFLNRVLPIYKKDSGEINSIFVWISFLVLLIFSYFKGKLKVYLLTLLYLFGCFGLIFRSYEMYGYKVYFGNSNFQVYLTKVILIFSVFVLFYLLNKLNFKKNKNLFLFLIPLSFGFDLFLYLFRFTNISNVYYFGISLDNLRFLGISLANKYYFSIVNKDFPPYQADALLRFNFDKIWENNWYTFFVFPGLHILLAIGLTFLISKLSKKYKKVTIFALLILFVCYLILLKRLDPRIALI